MYKTDYNSPIGKILLRANNTGLCGLWFLGQKYFDADMLNEVQQNDNFTVFKTVKNWLDKYFEGKNPTISTIPLTTEGSLFRKEVWTLLSKIPYGETTTYGNIAKEIAQKRGAAKIAPQAVGGAIGHNPVSIIIPCHRVIAQNGNLTGYAGGIERKIWLLEHEGVDIS